MEKINMEKIKKESDALNAYIGKKMKTLTICLAVCGVLVSCLMSILAYRQTQEITHLIRHDVIGESAETKEDDVRIANEYFIRSTTNISDAYISGNALTLTDKEKETLDMATNVLNEIIKDGMSDFEKEKAVYDWMTTHLQNDTGVLTVIPTTQADCDNPYGVLKYHNAVCVGYATTFRLFMQMMEIDCKVVHNTDNYHTWDLVKIDDHWYHTDIYSDVGSDNYESFNMNDTICSRNQEWDVDYFPAADSLEYNMAYRERQKGCDIYDIPEKLRELVDGGVGSISLSYGYDFTEEKAFIASQIIDACDSKIRTSEQFKNYYLNYNFSEVDDGYLLTIYCSIDQENVAEEALTEKQIADMNDAVDDAFGDLTMRDAEEWEDLD